MTDTTQPIPPSGRSPVLNTATLIMGPTRSGKSSLLATFAEYIWTTYKLVTIYASLDDGGFPTQMQALVNRGIVWYWKPKTRSGEGLTHETLQRMAQGWMPRQFNPRTGEVAPNVEMVPPVTANFILKCPQGHVVRSVPNQNMLTPGKCPTCQTLTDLRNGKVETSVMRTPGFEKVGAYMFDGITSATQWALDDLSKRDMGGEKSALGGMVVSGGLTFGQNNRAQVGFVQNRAQQLVSASNSIPNIVVPPVWTALTQEGSDDAGLLIVGPLLAGVAKVAVAPQWFGDVIETAVTIPKDGTHAGKKMRRMYLQQWVDESNRKHLCGVRSYPGLLPSIMEDEDTDDPQQARFVNFNLGKFYELREAAAAQLEREYAAKYADAPGLSEGILTFGGNGTGPSAEAAPGGSVAGSAGVPGLGTGVPSQGGSAPAGPIAPTPPKPAAPSAPRKGPQAAVPPAAARKAIPGPAVAPPHASAPPPQTPAATTTVTTPTGPITPGTPEPRPTAASGAVVASQTQAAPPVIRPPQPGKVPPPPGRRRTPEPTPPAQATPPAVPTQDPPGEG